MLLKSHRARLAWIIVIAALLLPSSLAFAKKTHHHSRSRKKQAAAALAAKQAKAEPVIYVCQQGDTLPALAEKYSTTVESIIKLNSLPADTEAEAGLVLKIPAGKKVRGEANWRDLGAFDYVGSGDGVSFVEDALRYQGVPYVRAGTTSRGFDCSGLVYRVLWSHGLAVPRTAATLYNVGVPVSRYELHAGDLVFFNTTRRNYVSHVGIYIGNDNFVHASSSQHRVTVSNLNEGFYTRTYVGARRVAGY